VESCHSCHEREVTGGRALAAGRDGLGWMLYSLRLAVILPFFPVPFLTRRIDCPDCCSASLSLHNLTMDDMALGGDFLFMIPVWDLSCNLVFFPLSNHQPSLVRAVE
jgi:hypothetical protein